jgi:hypothetical protein
MKFCAFCGKQIDDNAIFCGHCGKATFEQPSQNQNSYQNQQNYQTYQNYQNYQGYQSYQTSQAPTEQKREPSGLAKAAKILMIIFGLITSIATYGIGLAWYIPMVISYSRKLKRGKKVSTGFKVCTLLFVSTIAGILMLCDRDL